MTKPVRTALCLALLLATTQVSAATKGKTMQEILEASTAADWRTPDPDNLLVMDIAGGRVLIELAPQFAPEHVDNIKTLAREGYWNGLSINRSHDNFVVQWGDPVEDPAKAKSIGTAKAKLPAEFTLSNFDKRVFHPIKDRDGWSKQAGFQHGFPAATDRKQTWMTHCY
ncbi:MAG: peptidylprolyl isomerase, partial [Arenimonas sp.]